MIQCLTFFTKIIADCKIDGHFFSVINYQKSGHFFFKFSTFFNKYVKFVMGRINFLKYLVRFLTLLVSIGLASILLQDQQKLQTMSPEISIYTYINVWVLSEGYSCLSIRNGFFIRCSFQACLFRSSAIIWIVMNVILRDIGELYSTLCNKKRWKKKRPAIDFRSAMKSVIALPHTRFALHELN